MYSQNVFLCLKVKLLENENPAFVRRADARLFPQAKYRQSRTLRVSEEAHHVIWQRERISGYQGIWGTGSSFWNNE